MRNAIHTTNISHLTLLHRGKVRDIYEVDSDHILIIATDRISAFDVIMPSVIPNKGAVLNSISNFWFERTENIIKNHCSDMSLRDVLSNDAEYKTLKNHAVIVKKMNNLPIEAIIRGYIIGSGWKDYQKTGAICGIELPKGLQIADKLPEPIYTPATKAAVGEHDENIDFEETVKLIGRDMAEQVKSVSMQIYQQAYEFALGKGIIIADTKFEFGLDKAGDLVLIDEVLTPDSSRFWPSEEYVSGVNPPSFDKQFVRDYLETLDWDKTAPGPRLPNEIIKKSYLRYLEAKTRLGVN